VSKRFKGKTCVYCVRPGSSETRDHVVAREFFPKPRPPGLPVAPACIRCNNEKSALEQYATTVLPFGATHAAAGSVLSTMVPGRLAGNQKLARFLAEKAGTKYVSRDGGLSWETEMVLPFDSGKVEQLFQMIARGLAYSEWGVLFPDADCVVHASFLTTEGRALFDRYFSGQGNKTGVRNLGDGIFVYEGLQSLESPQLTLLRMSLCGAILGGDPKARDERVSVVYALTAPRKMSAATKFVDLLRVQSAAPARSP
jgi:hypothetical protein